MRTVPTESLELLHKTACGDTGGSQAARSFLFGLTGVADPTGFRGEGALELRRLDAPHKKAALEVLTWWTGSTETDQPLYDILDSLIERFRGDSTDQKVFSALDKLERAQRLVNDAGEDLCSADGYSDEWSDITSLLPDGKRPLAQREQGARGTGPPGRSSGRLSSGVLLKPQPR